MVVADNDTEQTKKLYKIGEDTNYADNIDICVSSILYNVNIVIYKVNNSENEINTNHYDFNNDRLYTIYLLYTAAFNKENALDNPNHYILLIPKCLSEQKEPIVCNDKQ